MKNSSSTHDSVIATNKYAYYSYFVLETLEAGIVLKGTEVKAIRAHHVQLREGYVRIEEGQAWLYHVHVSHYGFGNRENHEPERKRKLLLHKREIAHLTGGVQQQGLTIVPLQMFVKNNLIKVTVGLCRGKKLWDKRQTIAQREGEREKERALSQQGKYQ